MGWGGDGHDLRSWQWEWGGEEGPGEVEAAQWPLGIQCKSLGMKGKAF